MREMIRALAVGGDELLERVNEEVEVEHWHFKPCGSMASGFAAAGIDVNDVGTMYVPRRLRRDRRWAKTIVTSTGTTVMIHVLFDVGRYTIHGFLYLGPADDVCVAVPTAGNAVALLRGRYTPCSNAEVNGDVMADWLVERVVIVGETNEEDVSEDINVRVVTGDELRQADVRYVVINRGDETFIAATVCSRIPLVAIGDDEAVVVNRPTWLDDDVLAEVARVAGRGDDEV